VSTESRLGCTRIHGELLKLGIDIVEFGDMRWELEPLGGGTRLTLWHSIDRRFISWGPRAGTSVSTCWITGSAELPSAALLVAML
jgi:hypothetical protein